MKVLFAGPSIYGTHIDLEGIELRPPAAQGDLAQAVLEGASAIGLVDGNFEAIASVWHKEILFALNEGVTVAGAASMGALRAAECALFGMIPIGKIAKEYLNGTRDDDADVAMQHGPAALGCPPVTDAMVDVEKTLSSMQQVGCINSEQAKLLLANARRLFFKERKINAIVAGLNDADNLIAFYKKHFISQKQIDALEMVDFLYGLPASRRGCIPSFQLEEPQTWTVALAKIKGGLRSHP
ncbi:MAG: antibiotic resistance protein [Gammaproteobacteria bacterium]|nr:antibiotic resistance protein [Gammaproteobacteria bacterium]